MRKQCFATVIRGEITSDLSGIKVILRDFLTFIKVKKHLTLTILMVI